MKNLFRLIEIYFIISIFGFTNIASSSFAKESTVNSPAASQEEILLIPEHSDKRILVPTNNISTTWRTHLNFDDSAWELCTGGYGGIGYEKDSGYENFISLDVGSRMYNSGANPNTSCYIRIRFSVDGNDLNQIDYLSLNMLYDDGFIAYINGKKVAEVNAPSVPNWNSNALDNHEATTAESFVVQKPLNVLIAGENLLAIHGLNISTSSSDFLIAVKLIASKDYYQNFTSNLPIFCIETYGKPIIDDIRTTADLGIIYHGIGQLNKLSEPFDHFWGRISIELRGSSSLGFPKNNYTFETQDSLGNNLNVSLLGLPRENDWVLHGPYSDKSLIRNVLVYQFARDMGNYASRSRLCELFLNGDYRGVYVLLEKIKRDKNRVNISELTPTAIEGDLLTGGYIIKLDKEPWKPGFVSPYPPPSGSPNQIKYQYHYPKASDIVSEQEQYIRLFITTFETMMKRSDYTVRYPAYINTDSFVDFFLTNEFSKNVDAYRLSTFLYKDRDSIDGRLHMGPVWDFNLAFGNADYYDGWNTAGWELIYLLHSPDIVGDTWQVPFWWQKLVDDDAFTRKIHDRWFSLRQTIFREERIVAVLDSLYHYMKDARIRNFERWPVLGKRIWPNYFIGQTYDQEFQYLQNWILDRLAWMDDEITLWADISVNETESISNQFWLGQNYPNPFNPLTHINYSLPELSQVEIKIFNLQGQTVRVLLDEEQVAGLHNVLWDGFNETGELVTSGLYVYRFRARSAKRMLVDSKKMLLLR